jgi:hypothetical protein
MNDFTIGGAWSKGFGFFSASAATHAIILIGMGVVAPLVLQYVVLGSGAAAANPATLGQAALNASTLIAMGVAMILVGALCYVLQFGAYFASWRLGVAAGDTAGSAIGYGLLAGLVLLVAMVLVIALVALAAVGAGQGSGGAAGLALLIAIPLLVLMCAFYTTVMSMVEVAAFFGLLLLVLVGSSLSRINPSLDLGRLGGAVALIMFVLLALFFWLTVRLSCTGPAMARRRTVNLFAGMSESWRLTGRAQWKIMGHLVLVGLLMCISFLILALILGRTMGGMPSGGLQPGGFQPGAAPRQLDTAQLVGGLILGIPVAYLTVLVPGGIFRELAGTVPEGEVFA